jgi:Collagen triple helix repeat (20 copies)
MINLSDFSKKETTITGGNYPFGSTFKLLKEIKGYKTGDIFILVEQEDCLDPSILKLGGVGETYLLDKTGTGLIIHADDNTINPLFEYVSLEKPYVVTPTVYITDSQFKEFRSNIAEALSKIASLVPKTGDVGSDGDEGAQGEKGDQGIQGEVGAQGVQGIQGEVGAQGEKGDSGIQGEVGIRGEKGEVGVQGEKGDQGIQGERGSRGEKGDRGQIGLTGLQGEQGQDGNKGDIGEQGIRGEQGIQGERGAEGKEGAIGKQGINGIQGDQGKDGQIGATGKDGKAGVEGEKGSKGDRGLKGTTGDSGLVSAKFPLVYDAEQKTIAIDEARLDKILKRILGGGNVSPKDMGWLASTGGGGKVAIKYNGVAITPDVRAIDFTGSGVASVTKLGGKVTVNITNSNSGVLNGVTDIISNDGRITIDASQGVSFNGPIYLTGDLIVTGRIVTSTGIFGATANALTEPVSDMIMDGGSF